MKRYLASALIIGASSFGMVGCENKEAGVKSETTVTAPDGSQTTETKEHKVETDAAAPAVEPTPAATPAPAPAPAEATPAVTPEPPK